MKKNCNGCRASERNSCQLGYPVQQIHVKDGNYAGLHLENKPLAECPKPKTVKEYLIQREIYRKAEINGYKSTDTFEIK